MQQAEARASEAHQVCAKQTIPVLTCVPGCCGQAALGCKESHGEAKAKSTHNQEKVMDLINKNVTTLAQAQATAQAHAAAQAQAQAQTQSNAQAQAAAKARAQANAHLQAAAQAQAVAQSNSQADARAQGLSQPEVHAPQPQELRSTEVVLEESNTPKRKQADLISDQLLLAQNNAAELK